MIRQFYDGYGEHFKNCDGTVFKYNPNNNCCDKPIVPKCEDTPKDLCKKECCEEGKKIFGLDTDDIILIALLLFLLNDGVEDYILIIIIGIIFLLGIMDKKEGLSII